MSQFISASHPTEFSEHFEPLLSQRVSIDSVADTLCAQNAITTYEVDPMSYWTMDSANISIKVPLHCSRGTLTLREKSNLFQLYCKLYSVSDHSNVVMSSMYMRYSHLFVNGKLLGSYKSRTASSSTVIASWDANLFGPCSEESGGDTCRAARLHYFCKHSAISLLTCLGFCIIQGKMCLASQSQCGTTICLRLVHTIVPVQLVKSRSVCLVDKLDHEDVFVVIRCVDF